MKRPGFSLPSALATSARTDTARAAASSFGIDGQDLAGEGFARKGIGADVDGRSLAQDGEFGLWHREIDIKRVDAAERKDGLAGIHIFASADHAHAQRAAEGRGDRGLGQIGLGEVEGGFGDAEFEVASSTDFCVPAPFDIKIVGALGVGAPQLALGIGLGHLGLVDGGIELGQDIAAGHLASPWASETLTMRPAISRAHRDGVGGGEGAHGTGLAHQGLGRAALAT